MQRGRWSVAQKDLRPSPRYLHLGCPARIPPRDGCTTPRMHMGHRVCDVRNGFSCRDTCSCASSGGGSIARCRRRTYKTSECVKTELDLHETYSANKICIAGIPHQYSQ